MKIIDSTFKTQSDVFNFIRKETGLIEASEEDKERWPYASTLWTSPANFIGCELICKGESVGPISSYEWYVSPKYGGTRLFYHTEKGKYFLTASQIKFYNKIYEREQILDLHPTRSGKKLWSDGNPLDQEEYKTLYYTTEEYRTKYEKGLNDAYGTTGCTSPIQITSIREKISQTIQKNYGTSWFLNRGNHYSAITETMFEKFGVENFFYRGPHYSAVTETMLKKYGAENIFLSPFSDHSGVSNAEMELVDYIVEDLKVENCFYAKLKVKKENQIAVKDTVNKKTYYVDFLCPEKKIIIEFQGDYWHCNPKLYGPNYIHQHTKKTASEVWERDSKRKEQIEIITGYKVIIVWEQDWEKNNKEVKEFLKEIFI